MIGKAKPRRFIRLKEWSPGLDELIQPTPQYVAATDGSLIVQAYRIRTDASGLIVAPPAPDDNASCHRLIIFGDSLVESIYVPEPLRFPAALQAKLRNEGAGITCLNGGYSGATTLHLLNALVNKVGRATDATVLLIVPVNDSLALLKKGGFWRMTDKRYAPIVPVPPTDAEDNTLGLDLSDLRCVLPLFVDACRRLGVALLLATFPHRTSTFEADPWLRRRFKQVSTYTRNLAWRHATNNVVRTVAASMQVPLVDLDVQISQQHRLFYDDLHMNEAGSERMASLLCSSLRHRWIDQPAESGAVAATALPESTKRSD